MVVVEFELVVVAVPGVVLTPWVPVVPVLLPAPTAPLVLSGVVVVADAPVEDCGVVVAAPAVPDVPVPTVELLVPMVSVLDGVVLVCPLMEPVAPFWPTEPLVLVVPVVPVVVVVVLLWPVVPTLAPAPLWPAAPAEPAPAPAPACA